MKQACIALFVVSLFVSAQGAHAGIVARSSDLNGFAGIIDLDRGDTEFVIGGRYSYNFNPRSAIEGSVGFLSPENTRVFVYEVNYRNNFPGAGNVVPFLIGGIGAVKYSFDENVPVEAQALEGTSFAVNFGGGLHYFATENTAIRFDARDTIIFFGEKTVEAQTIDGGNTNNVGFTVGVSFFFI
jgi:opacity protein-like surface antigen